MTDDIHDAAALYAVDALTGDELSAFESHLAGCAQCQEEVNAMRRVTELLSEGVQAQPPASLRTSVLAGIAEMAQEPGPQHRAEPTAPPSADPQVQDTNVVPLRRPERRSARTFLPYVVAAAAVVVALVFGGWALQSRHNEQQANDQRAEITALLGAPDVRSVSGKATGGGAATVIASPARDEALFVGRMPTLPSGKVYELWTIAGKNAPVPAGTFDTTTPVVHLPDAALSADAVAVSVEPDGGSPQPTTTPILALVVAPAK